VPDGPGSACRFLFFAQAVLLPAQMKLGQAALVRNGCGWFSMGQLCPVVALELHH
jgi:hypothetical protein